MSLSQSLPAWVVPSAPLVGISVQSPCLALLHCTLPGVRTPQLWNDSSFLLNIFLFSVSAAASHFLDWEIIQGRIHPLRVSLYLSYIYHKYIIITAGGKAYGDNAARSLDFLLGRVFILVFAFFLICSPKTPCWGWVVFLSQYSQFHFPMGLEGPDL